MKFNDIGCLFRCIASVLTVGAALDCAAGQLTVNVDAGADVNIADAVDIEKLISSGDDLVKTGGGRLVIDRSLKGYKGEIQVTQGYLLATHNEAFGDIDKGTVVSSGATLEFKHDTEGLLFGKEQFTVSGTGVDGCGALCHVGTVKDQWRAVFEKITLAGDTKFGGTPSSKGDYRRWDIRGSQGTFDMQGHDLEIVCGFGIAGATVVNPGNITVAGEKTYLYFEGSGVRMEGSAENTITLRDGASLSSQKFKPALQWSVVIDGGRLMEQTFTGDYLNYGRIDGPVTITGKGATLHASAHDCHWSFGGKVTVNGPVSLSTGNSNRIAAIVLCDEDDMAVQMQSYRDLRANADQSRLNVRLRIKLCSKSGEVLPAYAGDLSNERLDMDVAGGTGVALSGDHDKVKYRQFGGYVKLEGADKVHAYDDIVLVGDSTLDVSGANTVDIHTNSVNVGGLYPAIARLRISDTSLVTNWTDRVKGGSKSINVGPVRSVSSDGYKISDYYKGRGILEICDGAVVSNVLNIGYVDIDKENERALNSMCHGSLFVRGGLLATVGSPISGDYLYNRIGASGSGYVEVSGGTVVLNGTVFPASGKAGRGLWYQKGGEVQVKSSTFIFGQYSKCDNPSKGVYYQTGGVMESAGGFVFGKTLYDAGNAGNKDQFTVAGGEMTVNSGIDLAGATNAETIVNLNGGTLKAMFMQTLTNENQTIVGGGSDKTLTGTYAWINLNGGTYSYLHRTDKLTGREAYKAKSFFYGDPERMRLTAYAGGAILDTAGHDRNLDHAITAPSGKGLVSLALPEDVTVGDWMFAGAPYIEIEGDGSGASAVAEFDSVNGRITGFTVTSPGNDYTEISAMLARGGYTNSIPLVCTLGKVASGGFAKKGEGVLRMNAANTYEGVTRVEGGTLKAVHAGAIPAGNGIEIAGGTLDAGGFEKPYGAISATSGTLQNATGTYASFVKTGEGAFMFNAPLSGSAPLEVREGTLKLPVSVPGFACGEKIYAAGESKVEYDKGIPLTNLGVDLATSLANTGYTAGYYAPSHYVSYSGYAWNRSATNVTWTFAYAFDDVLNIYVNGEKLVSEMQSDGSWGTLRLASATLHPGANSILIQLYNATGDGGAITTTFVHGGVNWTADKLGITYNPNGGSSTNGLDYTHLADPGDGSVFTVYPYDGSTLPSYGSLKMWPGTALDVCGGTYAFTGNLQVADEVFANPIRVLGGISFGPGATVDVDGIEALDREAGVRTVLVTDSGISGILPKLECAWRLRVSADGKNLELVPRRGTSIVLR